MLFSFTTDDGLYPSAEFVTCDETLAELESKWDDVLPFVLDYNYTISDESLRSEIARNIKTFYFGNETVSANTKQNVVEVSDNGENRKRFNAQYRNARSTRGTG